MADALAFVYDAIRTPRGKGKKDGSLHEVKPVDLVVTLLDEVRKRNDGFDTERVDDVVLGVVSPIGDQGGDIAKTAALAAGYPETTSGVQLNRFCASGLEAVNQAAARIRSGWEDLILAGGVESMSRVPMGSDGGAVGQRPGHRVRHRVRPAGHRRRPDRHHRGLVPRGRRRATPPSRRRRAAKAQANGYFDGSVVPVKDLNGLTVLEKDEFIRPGTTVESLSEAQAVVRSSTATSASTPSRWRSTTGSRRSTTSTTPATPRASSTAPRWWRSAASRSAPTSASPRAPASSRPPSPAPTRRSC